MKWRKYVEHTVFGVLVPLLCLAAFAAMRPIAWKQTWYPPFFWSLLATTIALTVVWRVLYFIGVSRSLTRRQYMEQLVLTALTPLLSLAALAAWLPVVWEQLWFPPLFWPLLTITIALTVVWRVLYFRETRR